MTVSVETIETAKLFAQWKPDPNVDQTMKCSRCGKFYDYRIFLIHKCNAR
jgi:hypothetical protein